MRLFRTKTFKKEYFRLKITDNQYTKYIEYLSKLINSEELPPEAKDHELKGELADFREFHLSGDLLVIYQIDEENQILKLLRIGTHSQLFKKF